MMNGLNTNVSSLTIIVLYMPDECEKEKKRKKKEKGGVI